MAIFAQLADGRQLEFPDGTDPAVVQRTVKGVLAQAQPKPEDPGVMGSAVIGAGRATDKLVQGVRQLYNGAVGDSATLEKMKADEAEKDAAYATLKQQHPIATSLGETAPAFAAAIPTGGTSLLANAGAAAVIPALSYGTAGERAKEAGVNALGAGVGTLVGKAVGRVLQPAGRELKAVSDDALAAANRIGYKPTPGQLTQNPAMMNFENYLARSPGSSGVMQELTSANQSALNRAGAKAMGQTANSLDEGVMAAAKNTIGSEFDRLGAITKPDLTGNFINTLAKIDADNSARGAFRSGEVDKLVNKALDLAASNNLDGKAYKEIRTALANEAQSAYKAGDATTGAAYKSLYGALDDAAKASLSKADQEAWDVARKQWQAFKVLSKSNVAEAGDVSAARTAAALRAQGPSFRTGAMDGPMADIGRVGEAFKGVQNPNSGQLTQHTMFINPSLSGLGLTAGNRIAAGVYNNPMVAAYLSRGLLPVGPATQSLLSAAGAQAAIPYTRGLLGVE